jgi:hypothetical protein
VRTVDLQWWDPLVEEWKVRPHHQPSRGRRDESHDEYPTAPSGSPERIAWSCMWSRHAGGRNQRRWTGNADGACEGAHANGGAGHKRDAVVPRFTSPHNQPPGWARTATWRACACRPSGATAALGPASPSTLLLAATGGFTLALPPSPVHWTRRQGTRHRTHSVGSTRMRWHGRHTPYPTAAHVSVKGLRARAPSQHLRVHS